MIADDRSIGYNPHSMKKHSTTVYPLAGGAELLFINVPNAAAAYVTFNIHSGYRHAISESIDQYPVPHLLEHMVFNGSKNYPSLDVLSRAIKKGGTYSNGHTTPYVNYYDFRGHPRAIMSMLPAAFDMIYRPLLTDESFDQEREVVLRETEESIGAYDTVADMESMLSATPDIAPDFLVQLTLLEKIDTESVKRYHKKHYTAANTQVIMAADSKAVDVSSLIKILDGEFKQIPKGKRHACKPLTVQMAKQPAIPLATPDEIQTLNVSMNFFREGKCTPEIYQQLAIFCDLLASDEDYSVFNFLRSKGYVYSFIAYPSQSLEGYGITLGFVGDRSKYIEVLTHLLAQVRNYAREGVPTDAFDYLKESAIGGLQLSLETPTDHEEWYSGPFIHQEPLETPDQVAKVIQSVEQSQLLTMIQEVVTNEQLHIAIIGGESRFYVDPTDTIRKEIFNKDNPKTEAEIIELAEARKQGVPTAPVLGTILRLGLAWVVAASFVPTMYDLHGTLHSFWGLGLAEGAYAINLAIVTVGVAFGYTLVSKIRKVLPILAWATLYFTLSFFLALVFYVDMDKTPPDTFIVGASQVGLLAAVLLFAITATHLRGGFQLLGRALFRRLPSKA